VTFVIVAIAGAIVVYSLSGWSVPAAAKNLKNPFPPDAEALLSAKDDYAAHCEGCHGVRGDGKGERAERLSIAPADFADTHAMSLHTDGELFWKITVGNRPMPSFKKRLSEDERWQVIDYIRTFSQPQLYSPVPPAAPPSAPR